MLGILVGHQRVDQRVRGRLQSRDAAERSGIGPVRRAIAALHVAAVHRAGIVEHERQLDRLRGVQHLGHHVDLQHVEVHPETLEVRDRQELRIDRPLRAHAIAVAEFFDVIALDGELIVPHREGFDVVRHEVGRLRLVEFAGQTGQRQRSGIDRVREVGLVAGVAGDIDRAAHHQEKRDRHGAEENENVASLAQPKRLQGTAKNKRTWMSAPAKTSCGADTRNGGRARGFTNTVNRLRTE